MAKTNGAAKKNHPVLRGDKKYLEVRKEYLEVRKKYLEVRKNI